MSLPAAIIRHIESSNENMLWHPACASNISRWVSAYQTEDSRLCRAQILPRHIISRSHGTNLRHSPGPGPQDDTDM